MATDRRLVRRPRQAHELALPRLDIPEGPDVRLVPGLDLLERPRLDLGMLIPEGPAVPVAVNERLQEARVRAELLRHVGEDLALVGRLGAVPFRGVEHDRQGRDVALGQRADDAVRVRVLGRDPALIGVERLVLARHLLPLLVRLDRGPVDLEPHRAHALMDHVVQLRRDPERVDRRVVGDDAYEVVRDVRAGGLTGCRARHADGRHHA